MDQVAALHWIKDNIGAFGGSPGNVTLLGTKRGAIFVNLLMLSPLAKGKFSTSTWTDDNSINLAVSRTKPTCLNWERPLFHYACSMLCSLTRDQHRTGKLEEPLQSYLITSASCFFLCAWKSYASSLSEFVGFYSAFAKAAKNLHTNSKWSIESITSNERERTEI